MVLTRDNILLAVGIVLFSISTLYSLAILESDRFDYLSGTSFGDGMAWAHSARIKFLHGVWYREYLDDWRPVFMVPMHSLLVWIGFESFGQTLTGLRAFPFVFAVVTKLLICVVLGRELGRNYFSAGLILLSLYAPINELGRTGAVDSVQTGLIFCSVFLVLSAERRNSNLLRVLAGALLAIATLFKISALLLFAFPFVFYAIRLVREGMNRDRTSTALKDVFFVYLGVVSVSLLYVVFWVIPYLDEIIYFSWRMFGLSANITMPWAYEIIGMRILNFFNPGASYVLSFHIFWVISILGLSMALATEGKRRWSDMETAFVAIVIIFPVQIILFDMQWHRYYGLMPFGCYAAIKLISMLFEPERYKMGGRIGVLSLIVFLYCFYLILYRGIYPIQVYREASELALPVVISIVLGALAYFFVIKYKARALPFALAAALLYVLPVNVTHSHKYFTDVNYHIRENSLRMGEALAGKRVFGGYQYSLYNNIEAAYLGSHAGQYKPDGWRSLRENLTMQDYVDRYHQTKWQAYVLWLLDKYYPGFIDRWYLPSNYVEIYNSNKFAVYRNPETYQAYLFNHIAKRHLYIGFEEEEVYIMPFYMTVNNEFGNKVSIPVVEEPVVTVKRPKVSSEASIFSDLEEGVIDQRPQRIDRPGLSFYRVARE